MKFGVTVAEMGEGFERLGAVLRGDKQPDGTVRCWWCGVEPLSIIDTSTLSSTFTTTTAGRWPRSPDGHQHAEQPPTPAELEQSGHEVLMRIRHAGM